ncbi:oxidoreductase [Actinokineospora guangxiensis]|uniref:Oxidoreductase n=1 Tax=Actinokineospora guangxiensis TaxID=1490288 RepID=A0ABW0ERK8_9PSEU
MSALGPVLITGCSSGIGHATALRLVRSGHTVYATARRASALAELATAGATVRELDITDEVSMKGVVEDMITQHGRVGAVVNNAGYGAYGAVEDVPLQAMRAQFETNVFGAARLIQLALPSMREAGQGRIVNLSSMGGRLTFPFGGYYHASKHAVEALSDALRFEVKPFGVRVSIVEPGLITTRFGETAADTMTAATPAGSAYAATTAKVEAAMGRSYGNRLMTAGPDAVAKAVEHALTARRPKSRYVVTPAARGLITVRAAVPGKAWDRVVGSLFGI